MKASSLKYYWEVLGKRDWLLAIVLFIISFITRLPFRSHYLYSWDSGNFAAALSDYNPILHQPHPPGYPLYIAVGKFLNIFLPNANTAFVAISILCGAVSVPLIYFAGKRIFNRATGVVAAFLMLASPLVLFQSEVALAHITELPFAILVTWLLYEVFFNRRYSLVAAVVIGIGGGFRQDVLMFFGPIILVGAFRLGFKRGLLALLALSASVLVWFLPFLYFVGNWEDYSKASRFHTQSAMQEAIWNVGISALLQNAKRMFVASLWLIGAGIILVPTIMVQARSLYRDRKIWFLLSLTVLPVLFFLITSFSHHGYSLIYAPAIVLILSYSTWVTVRSIRKNKLLQVVVIALAVVIGYLNVATYRDPALLSPSIHTVIGAYSGGAISKVDSEIDGIVNVAKQYDSSTTLIVFVGPGNDPIYYRQANYYLPEFRQIWLRPDIGGSIHDTVGGSAEQINSLQIQVGEHSQLLLFSKTAVNNLSVSIVKLPETGSLEIGPYSFISD